MVTVKARYSNKGIKISDKDVSGVIIKNKEISGIMDNVNFRLLGDKDIE